MMMVLADRLTQASILLASDSEDRGARTRGVLEQAGFRVAFAGEYDHLDTALLSGKFDMVLLEVSGQHAVEAAVAAALRVKRSNAEQIVGYLADSSLGTSGLGGDGIFPRNSSRLPATLRAFLSGQNCGRC